MLPNRLVFNDLRVVPRDDQKGPATPQASYLVSRNLAHQREGINPGGWRAVVRLTLQNWIATVLAAETRNPPVICSRAPRPVEVDETGRPPPRSHKAHLLQWLCECGHGHLVIVGRPGGGLR